MTPPKPPRDDDTTPVDSPRLRTPATPVRGTPLVRPVTERGGGPAAHQVYGPPQRRKEESWEDKTPTTDPEMYKAVKELKTQTAAQNIEIAVIKSEVSGIKEAVGDMRDDIKGMSTSLVRVATLVEADRSRVTLTETEKTATATIKGVLADRLLDQQERKLKFWETVTGKAVGAGGVLTVIGAAVVALITQGQC